MGQDRDLSISPRAYLLRGTDDLGDIAGAVQFQQKVLDQFFDASGQVIQAPEHA